MRVTKHNARGTKGSSKGFTAKHNDRSYDIEKADNIHEDKTKYNRYWNCMDGKWYGHNDKDKKKTFEEVEEKYYRKHFKKQWQTQVEKHQASRHTERIKSFDDWRKSKRYCPEEVFVQIGNVDKHADADTLRAVAIEYLTAEAEFARQHNQCFVILDAALHFDEAVPQLHLRKVWRSKNADGIEVIGQNEALRGSGLSLPKPGEPEDKYNNFKVVYDAIMREKLLDICEAHGLSVEREPERNAKHNQSKAEMLTQKIKEQEKKLKELNNLEDEEILSRADNIRKRNKQSKQNSRGTEFDDYFFS